MPTEKHSATAAWGLGGLIFGCLVIKNAGLASPLLAGDEYAYFAQAKVFPTVSSLHERDPAIQRVFNPLFAGLGHLFMEATRYAERALASFNVLLFAVVVLAVVHLAKRLSVSGAPALTPALVAVVSPLSVHTAYFMPETLYFTLALGVLTILALGLERAALASVAVAGGLVGALALVKSHALSVLGAGLLSLLLIGWLLERTSFARIVAMLAVFLVAAATSVSVLYFALTRQVLKSPGMLLGFYSGFVSKSAEASTWTSNLPAMLGNLGAHGVVALCLAAPPLGTLVIIVLRALRRDRAAPLSRTDAARLRFACVALSLLAGALAMTVVFTVAVYRSGESEQILRLHGRYYSYTLLPIVVAYFSLQDILTPRDTRILAGVGLLSTLGMLFVRARFHVYPWDYPEAYVFTDWAASPMRWAAYLVLALGALMYAAQLWRPSCVRFSYPAFLIAAYVLANVATTRWQYEHSATNSRYSDAGRAVNMTLGQAELDRTLVVAPGQYGNAPLAHFLFGLAANPFVVTKAVGARIDQSELPADVAHLVTLGTYSVGIRQRASLGVADWTLYELAGSGPRLRETAVPWERRAFSVLLGIGHDTAALDGFNEPEPWGAWTALDPASVELPMLVSGPMRVLLDGWAAPENVSTDVDVAIGGVHASVRFGGAREIRCLVLDVPQPSRELVIHGATPRRPDPYHSALGLALTRVTIAAADDRSLAEACAQVPAR